MPKYAGGAMDQKQRDKIAWVLAALLGFVLMYLLAVNVFKGGEKSTPPPPPSVGELAQSQAPEPGAAARLGSPKSGALRPDETALDPKVLAEQQQIAARLPRRNPFSVAPADTSPPVSPRRVALTVNDDMKLKVTAIVSQQGANKRIAMISGKMLEEGDRIGEWTILKVNPKNVVLGNGARQMVVGVK